jgi:catechol 2,3-dioxygenase-like lactoylglutathione lyase family enzyme
VGSRLSPTYEKRLSREFADAKENATGTLSRLSVGWNTDSEEARLGLSRYKVAAAVAVSNMDRARKFYEGKLGLSMGIDSGDNVQYRCAEGTVMHVYLSPEHAGKSTATLVGWGVEDVERVVDELTSKGVTFERYDEGPIITDERGIAAFEGGAKVAYFKDPDGNTHSIAQAPRT